MKWFDLVETQETHSGILELPENLTPPGLALELFLLMGEGPTMAWWMLEDGRRLMGQTVGEA